MPQSVFAPNTRQGSTPALDPTVIKLIDADGPRLGRNRECWDNSRRIIRKLRGERYCNASNEWLAKFIQEELFTFDYEETAAWYGETAQKRQRRRAAEQRYELAASHSITPSASC